MTTTSLPQAPKPKGRYKLWVLFINHTAAKPVQQFYHKLPRIFQQVNNKWSGRVQHARVYDTLNGGDCIWKYNIEDGWQTENKTQTATSAPTI